MVDVSTTCNVSAVDDDNDGWSRSLVLWKAIWCFFGRNCGHFLVIWLQHWTDFRSTMCGDASFQTFSCVHQFTCASVAWQDSLCGKVLCQHERTAAPIFLLRNVLFVSQLHTSVFGVRLPQFLIFPSNWIPKLQPSMLVGNSINLISVHRGWLILLWIMLDCGLFEKLNQKITFSQRKIVRNS